MIRINNVKKEYGVKTVFEINQLTINPKDKIALIGENGSGKTTFANILAGLDEEYTGSIETSLVIEKLDWANEGIVSNQAYSRMNLNPGDHLSPGQRYQLILLSYLEKRDSYLILDEPSSHLDFEAKDFFIELLQEREYGFLLISHDRDFIQETCHKVIEIEDGRFDVYNGDYALYLEEKKRHRHFEEREYENYQEELNRLQGVVRQIEGKSASIKSQPKRYGNSEARLHKMGGQSSKKKLDNQVKAVKSRIDQLEVKKKPRVASQVRIDIPSQNRIEAKVLIEGKDVSKAFGDNVVFEQANFTIRNHTKVALLGENGSGKTTLLNMILDGEDIAKHPRLKIGYFSQLNETLDVDADIYTNVMSTSMEEEHITRIILDRFGLGTSMLNKKVRVLSDGERAKVKLTKLLTSGFNFLMFDEPTNHLDIYTIEALEGLLVAYQGPILFVSHDRRFVDQVADHLLIIEDKKIRMVQGKLREVDRPVESSEDKLLVDFRIAYITSALAGEIPSEERVRLMEELDQLQKKKSE